MEHIVRTRDKYSKAATLCAAVAIGFGLAAIVGWATGLGYLARISGDYIPMAPSTAVSFVLLGGALLAHSLWPANRAIDAAAKAASLVVIFFAFVIAIQHVLRYAVAYDLDMERLWYPDPGMFEGYLVARMSPVTAGANIFAGVALWLILGAHGRGGRREVVAGVVSVAVTTIGAGVCLGYLLLRPIFFGGPIVPVALTTGFGMSFLGLGLIFGAGPSRWPLKLFVGASVSARLMRVFFPVALVAVLADDIIGYAFRIGSQANPALMASAMFILVIVAFGMIVSRISGSVGAEIERAEEEIRRSENLLNKIFDVLPVGLWFADKKGKLLRGNPAGRKIWGAEPTVGREEYGVFKARRLPSGKEVAPDDWALVRTIDEGATIMDELLEIETFDGKKKIILNYTAPVFDNDGQVEGAIIINVDITDRKRVEEQVKKYSENLECMVEERTAELERARSDLFSAAKLAAMGRLAAGVAHQLNSPLGGGMLLIDSLAGACRGDSDKIEMIGKIRGGMERMRDVINCMLSLAMVDRMGRPTEGPVEVNGILRSILDVSIRECSSHGVTVGRNFADGLPKMIAASGEIDQIFLNLINNAIDAMPGGGTLTIETRMGDDAIEVVIADTGEGIPPENIDNIFEPFFTTRRGRRGLGLGLSIAVEIATRRGGEISVESAPGKGTAFTVKLPLEPSFR